MFGMLMGTLQKFQEDSAKTTVQVLSHIVQFHSSIIPYMYMSMYIYIHVSCICAYMYMYMSMYVYHVYVYMYMYIYS